MVSQRYSHMGRVSDDHVRPRHLLHHSGLGHLALQLLDPPLDLGIALCLFVLFLDLLLAHAHLLFIVPPLVDKIHRGQHQKGQAHLEQHGKDGFQDMPCRAADICVKIPG